MSCDVERSSGRFPFDPVQCDALDAKLKEALTRAETEAEESRERHRTWMRQAQARQTELEATAAQLTEALAEANRKFSGSGEVIESVREYCCCGPISCVSNSLFSLLRAIRQICPRMCGDTSRCSRP